MNNIKIISVCFLVPFLVLMTYTFLKIKSKQQYQQKIVLAQETRKVLGYLMVDLREAREKSILDVPPDGLWHHRMAFDRNNQGALEYLVHDGQLFRINQGKSELIAEDINDIRIRRQENTPDLLEVEAKKNVSLISNLKIRVHS